MNNLWKLIRRYKIVVYTSQRCILTKSLLVGVKHLTPTFSYNCNVNCVRNMSQKSITSFFKITPKKTAEVKEEKAKEDELPTASPPTSPFSKKVKDKLSPKLVSPPKIESPPKAEMPPKVESSPIANGKDKQKPSKRQRVDSRDSDSQSPKTHEKSVSPVSSEKKKKSKRQRIESSSSESGSQKSETEIKVEKTEKPKTYVSPRIKKNKLKVEKSPLVEKNEKTMVKSPSPNKKVKVKQEKTEKSSKKTMSMFVKTSTGVSEKKEKDVAETEKDGGIGKGPVPEEEYNPAKDVKKYDPIADACWSKGQAVPYLALAKTLEAIEATSARLKIVDTLANYFRSVIVLTPEDLLPSVYMCLNQLAPAYHSLELGIAETYLMKAIGQCTGQTLAQVKSACRAAGDLGAVAERARATQRTMFAPPPLTARRVFAVLKEVAHMTGHASVNKKIGKIQTLYTACRYSEARYLIRSLEGKLRIGLAEQSVLQALALATTLTPPGPDGVTTVDVSKGLTPEQFKARLDEQALLIKTTYCECPNYDLMIPALLQHGVAALPQHCRLTPGIPLKPMLAHPTKGLHEVFNRFEKEQFTCEWKYDGERAQIHVPGDTAPDFTNAAVFSRNQENNTSKYPDIVRRLPSLLKSEVTSCVLDTEAVAYDTANKRILPFQILSTRKRKDAQEADIKVQVCVFVFDLLYLNGRALVRQPLAERRDLLRRHFNEVEGEWQFATSRDCSTTEEVQQFLDESIRGSCEGLMVKTLTGDHARYDIARRSHNWLKLKKDYLEGVGDTIDAVVIGAWWGKGKRAGALGGFLLACRDPQSDEFQALCKIGTGFSDEDLQNLTKTLQEHIIDTPKSYYRYDQSHSPDVWVSAACVWEVRCADLSLSPSHRAAIGLVDPDKGISLRFPRFVRVRDDKTPEEATSAQQIAEMYLAQDQVRNQAPRTAPHDDFY